MYKYLVSIIVAICLVVVLGVIIWAGVQSVGLDGDVIENDATQAIHPDIIGEVSASYADAYFTPMDIDVDENMPFSMKSSKDIFSILVDVSSDLVDNTHSTVSVTVKYLDVGSGCFSLLYNSSAPKIEMTSQRLGNVYFTGESINFDFALSENNAHASEAVQLSDSGEWLSKTFTLPYAAFDDALNGFDMAIVNYSDDLPHIAPTDLSICLVSIEGSGNNTSQDAGIFTYSITELSQNIMVHSGTQNIDENLSEKVTVNADVSQNGCYQLTVHMSEYIENTFSAPFSVMPFYDTDNTTTDIFGVCTHYGLPWFEGDVSLKANAAALSGAGWIRDEVRWSMAEEEKGVIIIPEQWDYFVDEAIAAGLQPVLILAYGNPHYDEGGPPHTEEALLAYANYVQAVTEHFKSRVSHFEIWNEYNHEAFNITSRPPQDYVSMLKVAYTTIKEVNPDATVIGGATSGVDIEWIGEILSLGAAEYMDALSYHPYTQPNNPEHGGFFYAAVEMPAFLEEYDVNLPLWVTEVGWPSAQSDYSVSEMEAAEYLARTYVLGIAAGVDKIFWYDLINDGIDPTQPEHNFGLLRGWQDPYMPLSAKYSYLAYNTVAGTLADAVFVGFSGLSDETFVAMFQKPATNTAVFVAWTLKDSDTLTLNVQYPHVVVRDIFSNDNTINAETGTVDVTLSSSPIFIECIPASNPIEGL